MALKTELVLALSRFRVKEFFDASEDAVRVKDDVVATDLPSFCREMGKYVVVAPRHLFEKGGDLAEDFVHFASYVTVVNASEDSGELSEASYNNIIDDLMDAEKAPGDVFDEHVRDKLDSSVNRVQHLIYSRNPAGGEAMLHGSLSIGFGGHVNPAGWVGMNSEEALGAWLEHCLLNGACQELTEEVLGEDWDWGDAALTLTHVVWDQSNEVGRYHLAAFGVFRDTRFHERGQLENAVELLPPLKVEYRDDAWSVGSEKATQNAEQALESWSKIMFEMIARGDIRTDY